MNDFVVAVKLHGIFRKYRPADATGAPHHPFPLQLPAGADVHDLLDALAIPAGFINAAAVNGVTVSPDTGLGPGDEVALFPPAAGG